MNKPKIKNVEKELEPLAKEAKKYKSAEEFIQKIDEGSYGFRQFKGENQTSRVYHAIPTKYRPVSLIALTDFYNRVVKKS